MGRWWFCTFLLITSQVMWLGRKTLNVVVETTGRGRGALYSVNRGYRATATGYGYRISIILMLSMKHPPLLDSPPPSLLVLVGDPGAFDEPLYTN